MIDARSVATAAIAAAALGAADLASADPVSQPVPNMSHDAALGQSCATPTGRYIFGYDSAGKVLACGRPGQPHVWVDAGTLVGVRQIGGKQCVEEIHALAPDGSGGFTAQSPDGVPLICAYPTDTWEIMPTH
ncbi:hypothetical protein [Mycobacterium sp.]|uniref:hypothetical protein n=1 Tax=Mycobacterium sp. TaxID=1785 RepID=UPI003C74885D